MTFSRTLVALRGMVSVMDNVSRGHTIARLRTDLKWNGCVVHDKKAPGWSGGGPTRPRRQSETATSILDYTDTEQGRMDAWRKLELWMGFLCGRRILEAYVTVVWASANLPQLGLQFSRIWTCGSIVKF